MKDLDVLINQQLDYEEENFFYTAKKVLDPGKTDDLAQNYIEQMSAIRQEGTAA